MTIPVSDTAVSDSTQPTVEERRFHILTAAVSLIAEQGYDGVRLRDVGKRAGVSIGLIQHYFDTRDELMRAAIVHLSEDLVARFNQAGHAEASAWGRIVALVDQLCAVPNLSEHSTMWVAFAAAVSKYPDLSPGLRQVYDAWRVYVEEAVDLGVSSGEFDLLGDRDDVIASYLAFFDGYEYDMATGLIPIDTDELRRRALLVARALFRPTGT